MQMLTATQKLGALCEGSRWRRSKEMTNLQTRHFMNVTFLPQSKNRLPFFIFGKKKQLRQQFVDLNQNRKLNVSDLSGIRWFLHHKKLLKVAAFSNDHCFEVKNDEMNAFCCGLVFCTFDFSSWASSCLSQWRTASCVFVHYSILFPFGCIARVPSWCEYMRSARSTAAAALALRAIVSQIGGFMIKISSLLFWWALMSPVYFEQPRMRLADNEERLNGVGFLSNLWVNKYCFLPIISSCLLVSLFFAFILSKSGMVHPLTPSDLLPREHSHKPIKQTQDTRMARTVRFLFGSWSNDGFLSGFTSWKWPPQGPRGPLFVIPNDCWFTLLLCNTGRRWFARCGRSGGTKGREGRQGMETAPNAACACASAGYSFSSYAEVKWLLEMQSRLSHEASITFNTHSSPLVIHNAEILILSRAVSLPDHLAFLSYK